MSGSKLKINHEKILDFRNGDFSKFRAMLKETDWDEGFNGQNCFVMWENFKQILINFQSVF